MMALVVVLIRDCESESIVAIGSSICKNVFKSMVSNIV